MGWMGALMLPAYRRGCVFLYLRIFNQFISWQFFFRAYLVYTFFTSIISLIHFLIIHIIDDYDRVSFVRSFVGSTRL